MKRTAKEVDKIEFEVPLRLGRGKNDRGHWRVAWLRTRKERGVIHLAWPKGKVVKGPWTVTLCRVAPKGEIDDDNLVASLKAVRDEVAKQLGVDDGNKDEIFFCYKYAKGPWAVKVEVEHIVPMLDSSVGFWMRPWKDSNEKLKAIGGRG